MPLQSCQCLPDHAVGDLQVQQECDGGHWGEGMMITGLQDLLCLVWGLAVFLLRMKHMKLVFCCFLFACLFHIVKWFDFSTFIQSVV